MISLDSVNFEKLITLFHLALTDLEYTLGSAGMRGIRCPLFVKILRVSGLHFLIKRLLI